MTDHERDIKMLSSEYRKTLIEYIKSPRLIDMDIVENIMYMTREIHSIDNDIDILVDKVLDLYYI